MDGVHSDHEERPKKLLDAARQLFFAQGYRATTMQQIAKHAGYSKRTVYLDYLNKDELFITVCTEGGKLLLAQLEEIPIEELPVEDCIDQFLDLFISFSREQNEYFRIIFSESTPEIIANCSVEVALRVAELERACLNVVVGLVERAIREGSIQPVDPWEAAGIFVGTATGIVLLSMGGSQTVFSKSTLETLARNAIRTYWRGLRVAGPNSESDGKET